MVLLAICANQLEPGTFSSVTSTPIFFSDSWIRIAIGSRVVASLRSNDSVVLKPFGKPASASSALAVPRSVPCFNGTGQVGSYGLLGSPSYIAVARPYRAEDRI